MMFLWDPPEDGMDTTAVSRRRPTRCSHCKEEREGLWHTTPRGGCELRQQRTESAGAWSWEAWAGLTVGIQHGSTFQVLLWARTLSLTHVSPSAPQNLVAVALRGESRKAEDCLHSVDKGAREGEVGALRNHS